ncbi:uncharacterized protein LOC111049866 [Nilaparvata lugens]|uniref:uncharacterized protein LOC111049866 n=1 Tax=Nilaparvata lugens TaxID=108931 RepID=UPI00193E7282|nr:uncharacterized protein LOC111049866 [Nilaparvata lugens]
MEESSATDPLDIQKEEDESPSFEQLSEKGNSSTQLDPDDCSSTHKGDKSSSDISLSVGDVNLPSSSKLSTDQKKDSTESANADNDLQRNSSTNNTRVSSAPASQNGNNDQNIEESLKTDSENDKDVNSDKSRGSFYQESAEDHEESTDNVFEESDNVHEKSGNVLEESENVVEEFLTLKMPQDTSSNSCDESSKSTTVEDRNSLKVSSENSGRNEDANTSNDDIASQLLFGNDDIEAYKKSSSNFEENEKSKNDYIVPQNNQKKGRISDNSTEDSSAATTNVERDMCALFSELAESDKRETPITSKNKSNKTANEKQNCSKTIGSEVGDAISPKGKVSGSNALLEDENTDFNTNRIEIKEEIESIENDNSMPGFDNDDTYSSDHLQESLIEACKRECSVVLERCDASLLNDTNPYQSDMKIVSVESLSSMNYDKKHGIVWSYFIKKTPTLAECKICGRALLHKRLSNLTRHLQTVHDHEKRNPELDKPSVKPGRESTNFKKIKDHTFKNQPLNYFSFINSQTARCKLCFQYMPYRCLDDLQILKSHLLHKHGEEELADKVQKKPARNIKAVADEEEKEEEEDEEDGDDEDKDKDYEGESNGETSDVGENVSERKPRQRTWSYFTKLERGLAQCNECLKCFSYSSGNLQSLTRHLRMSHNAKRSANQSSQKSAPPQKRQKLELPKKAEQKLELPKKAKHRFILPKKAESNSQSTNKTNSQTITSTTSPTGQQFLKYYSFLRSENALCKRCNTKVSYNNKNTKSLLDHYNQCSAQPQLDDVTKKNAKPGRPRKILKDESIRDPDFVTPDILENDEHPYPNKHKTQLMAAVQLSPKDKDWKHFKKINGFWARCVHCSKTVSHRGDSSQIEHHLKICNKYAASLDASLDDIPLNFRLKNQTKPYTLGDCYYRKKLEYNLSEIRRFFRRLSDDRLMCKLCLKNIQCSDTLTEILMSHILQEHVRKLFKPKAGSNEGNLPETSESPVCTTPPNNTNATLMSSPPQSNVRPLSIQKVQAQSTPLPTRRRRAAAAKPNVPIAKLQPNADKNEDQILSKCSFTLKYYLEFSANRQQCKLCNKQFVGNKSANLMFLSQHLLDCHLGKVIDDETRLSNSEENDQRKAIMRCTRRRIVNQFSKIDGTKVSCKMCTIHLEKNDFETMKTHLLTKHQDYLKTILKEVKRIENYKCSDMRTLKRLLTIRKKRNLQAKCSLCSREVYYRIGNTKPLRNHLLKLHKKTIGKSSVSKVSVWKHFTKQDVLKSKCEICYKFISTKVHCNHKVPKLVSLSTGLRLKKDTTKSEPENKSTELTLKNSSSSTQDSIKKQCYYFSALKRYNNVCIFCSPSLKNANKIICKIACRFNHGNEYINWLYKNDPVDQTFITANQTDCPQKTLSLLEMFDELKNKKMNSIKLCYSEFSNKYHCNLCCESISANYLRFSLHFDHALVKHKGLLSMHRAIKGAINAAAADRPTASARPQPPQTTKSPMQTTKSPMQTPSPKNTKLVKVKLWQHFKVVGSELASCNFCKLNFKYSSKNVDTLASHLRAMHLSDLLKLSNKSQPYHQPLKNTTPRNALQNTTPRNALQNTTPRNALQSTTPSNAFTTSSSTDESVKYANTWKYFTEIDKGAKCKLCAKQFLFSDKTHVAPLTRHLQTVHKITPAVGVSSPVPLPVPVPTQNKVTSEQPTLAQTKWAWQHFEKDGSRPQTAKCKLCLIYCSCTAEDGDLSVVLLKHLRIVHNKWLVNVGNKLMQNNMTPKRSADTEVAVKQPQKKVKFDDEISEDNNNSPSPPPNPSPAKSNPSPTKSIPSSSPAPSVSSDQLSEVSKKATLTTPKAKAKKSLKHFQDLEKTKTKKSLVWTYFTPIDGQPDFSRCNVCSKSISSKFGISILRTHLRVKHNILIVNMNQYSELKKTIGDTAAAVNLADVNPAGKINTTLPSGDGQVSPLKADQKMLNENITTPTNTTSTSLESKFEKRHPVWSYFKQEKNSNLLKCNLCSVYLSCKSGQISGLQNHLSAKHNIVFLEGFEGLKPPASGGEKSSPVKASLPTNPTIEKSPVEKPKPLQESPKTAKELYETTSVEESVVDNEVFYTSEDNLVTVTPRLDSGAVHYEIVETTEIPEVESADIVKVISDLLPNYSVGISDDVNATEISPQESELISNIVTSLGEQGATSEEGVHLDGDQVKSIAVLTGETQDASLTWDFYVKLSDNKVKCDVCSQVLTYDSDEAPNLAEHVQLNHPAELAQYKLSRLGFSDSCIIVVKNS